MLLECARQSLGFLAGYSPAQVRMSNQARMLLFGSSINDHVKTDDVKEPELNGSRIVGNMTREAKRFSARQQEAMLQAEARRKRAKEFAFALARQLGASDPSLLAVTGFGSTFEAERNYRLDSDIDLALSGGDWGKLWSLIPKSEFDVSLVELDLQPDAFAEQVRTKGVVLYEKR